MSVKIVHNKLLGGWYVVRGPHQAPLSGRFSSKADAKAWLNRKGAYSHLVPLSFDPKTGMKKNPSRRARAVKKVRRALEVQYKRTGIIPSRREVEAAVGNARMRAQSRGQSGRRIYDDDEFGIHPTFLAAAARKRSGLFKNPRKRRFSAKQIAAQKRFAKMARMRAFKNPRKKLHRAIYRYPDGETATVVEGRSRKAIRSSYGIVTRMFPGAKRASKSVVKSKPKYSPRKRPLVGSLDTRQFTRKNPRIRMILSATIRGTKYYFTGREWDTMRNHALRFRNLNKAKKKAVLLASKSGCAVRIES